MQAVGDGVDREVFLVHAAFPRGVEVFGVDLVLEVLDGFEQLAGFAALGDLDEHVLELPHRFEPDMGEPVDEDPHMCGADLPGHRGIGQQWQVT